MICYQARDRLIGALVVFNLVGLQQGLIQGAHVDQPLRDTNNSFGVTSKIETKERSTISVPISSKETTTKFALSSNRQEAEGFDQLPNVTFGLMPGSSAQKQEAVGSIGSNERKLDEKDFAIERNQPTNKVSSGPMLESMASFEPSSGSVGLNTSSVKTTETEPTVANVSSDSMATITGFKSLIDNFNSDNEKQRSLDVTSQTFKGEVPQISAEPTKNRFDIENSPSLSRSSGAHKIGFEASNGVNHTTKTSPSPSNFPFVTNSLAPIQTVMNLMSGNEQKSGGPNVSNVNPNLIQNSILPQISVVPSSANDSSNNVNIPFLNQTAEIKTESRSTHNLDPKILSFTKNLATNLDGLMGPVSGKKPTGSVTLESAKEISSSPSAKPQVKIELPSKQSSFDPLQSLSNVMTGQNVIANIDSQPQSQALSLTSAKSAEDTTLQRADSTSLPNPLSALSDPAGFMQKLTRPFFPTKSQDVLVSSQSQTPTTNKPSKQQTVKSNSIQKPAQSAEGQQLRDEVNEFDAAVIHEADDFVKIVDDRNEHAEVEDIEKAVKNERFELEHQDEEIETEADETESYEHQDYQSELDSYKKNSEKPEPVHESVDESYVDVSDPNDPKYVYYTEEVNSSFDPDEESYSRVESKTSKSIGLNPKYHSQHQHSSSETVSHSSSGSYVSNGKPKYHSYKENLTNNKKYNNRHNQNHFNPQYSRIQGKPYTKPAIFRPGASRFPTTLNFQLVPQLPHAPPMPKAYRKLITSYNFLATRPKGKSYTDGYSSFSAYPYKLYARSLDKVDENRRASDRLSSTH